MFQPRFEHETPGFQADNTTITPREDLVNVTFYLDTYLLFRYILGIHTRLPLRLQTTHSELKLK